MHWFDLGVPPLPQVPTPETVLEALRTALRERGAAPGRYAVVVDEDAARVAAPCWWAVRLDGSSPEEAAAAYRADGGTVSELWEVGLPEPAAPTA